MRSKYKGFTIVELAIVLVVIGIILAMAVKGKTLVDVARFKTEVNKMRKLEAAMHIYVVTHPPDFSKGIALNTLDLKVFYDLGILSPGELKSGYLGEKELDLGGSYPALEGSYGATYTPFVCNSEGREGHYYQSGSMQGTFCGGLSYWDFSEWTTNGGWSTGGGPIQPAGMPLAIQCGIEQMLDDEHVMSGLGRRGSTHQAATPDVLDSANFTDEEYTDCMALPFTEPTGSLGYWTGKYYYRVF